MSPATPSCFSNCLLNEWIAQSGTQLELSSDWYCRLGNRAIPDRTPLTRALTSPDVYVMTSGQRGQCKGYRPSWKFGHYPGLLLTSRSPSGYHLVIRTHTLNMWLGQAWFSLQICTWERRIGPDLYHVSVL